MNHGTNLVKLFYISPSVLPSRTANAVHVIHMCNALAQIGVHVTLFAKRTVADEAELRTVLQKTYGVELPNMRLVTYFGGNGRGDNLRIAMLALRSLWREESPALIVSRNLYASFIISVIFSKPLVFETHQLEYGFRKFMQRTIMRQSHVLTQVISQRLVNALHRHVGKYPSRSLVLHDAAPSGIEPLSKEEWLLLRNSWADSVGRPLSEMVCGYFGHLYPGRGIEIIEEMAQARPKVDFFVFGGNEEDIASRRESNNLNNLHFMGFLDHARVRHAMASMDLLLMPYQAQVSIGIKGHDTADWMSPMKMFEYMAVGVPFIASRLPALEEVLEDGSNCMLADPANADDWISSLDRLLMDRSLGEKIAIQAHAEYKQQYNWVTRATKMLEALKL